MGTYTLTRRRARAMSIVRDAAEPSGETIGLGDG